MIDADAFAALLCDCGLEAEGDQVMLSATTLAVPLAAAMHRAVLRRGAWSLARLVGELGIGTNWGIDRADRLALGPGL